MTWESHTRFAFAALVTWCGHLNCFSQDPVKVDPSHYRVEFENQHIRVLRFRLGPREKSPMHEHPARITTNLTSGRSRVTLGDGRSQEMESRAGEVAWRPAIRHAVENLTDKPLEIVTTELKPEPPHAAEVASRAKTVSKAKSTVRKKPAVKRVVKKAARRHRARKQGR